MEDRLRPGEARLQILLTKTADAIGVLGKFLARYPNVAEAHVELAMAHSSLGSPLTNKATSPAVRTRHLESAATHFRRAFDLTTDPGRRVRHGGVGVCVQTETCSIGL